MASLTPKEINQWLESVWGKRAQGLPLPEFDPSRPPTPEEMQYLRDHYPYLQIMSTDPQFEENVKVQFIYSYSGWRIHDYKQALSSSPGDLNYGYSSHLPLIETQEGEGGESTAVLPPEGTVVKQAFDTAVQMVLIAMQKGWPGIEIISGHRLMQWAAWAIAQERNYPFVGFEPTRAEEEKRQRIRHQLAEQAVSRLIPRLR